MVHGRRPGVRTLRALHELTLPAILLLLLGVAVGASAQDWSGASLRGAGRLALPEGYRAQVLARGLRLPQDLAVDPPDGLWVLTRVAPGGGRGAGALIRIPLDAPAPIDASQVPAVLIPFASSTVPFQVGSVARHPSSGDLYVTEARGRHLFHVTREGRVTVFARGANALVDGGGLAFTPDGVLLVLDFVGRSAVADPGSDPLRDLLGASDPYEGPVVYTLRVDEALPVPRNLEYAPLAFPRAARRRQREPLPRYRSLAVLTSGSLVASASGGAIDRLGPDGSVAPLARVTVAGPLVAGPGDRVYALDQLGGRIVQVSADGTAETFAEGLTRPAALAVLGDGTLVVAEDTGLLLRIRAPTGSPQ